VQFVPAPPSAALQLWLESVGTLPAQSESMAQPAWQLPMVAPEGTVHVLLRPRPVRVSLGHAVACEATVPVGVHGAV
jgi:hypothetical protein